MGLFVYDAPDVKPDFNTQGARLPWAHPRYQGRVFDVLLNERTGATVRSNGVHPITGTISDTTNITWTPAGLLSNTNTGYRRIAFSGINSSQFPSNEATLLIKCKSTITGSSDNCLTGFSSSGLASHWPYTNTSTAYVSVLYSARASWSITNSDLEKWHWFVVRTKPGTSTWECYRNLVLQYQQNGESTLTIGGTEKHCLMAFSTSLFNYFGEMECAFLYNRYLALSEIASIQDAPYLEYAMPRQWWFVPAAGGGVTYSPNPVVMSFNVPSPTFITGEAVYVPNPVTMNFSAPSPTFVPGAVTYNPDPAVMFFTVPNPSWVVGEVIAVFNPAVMSFVVAEPTFASGVIYSPDPVVITFGVPNPTYIVGEVVYEPDPAVMTFTVPNPSFIGGDTTTYSIVYLRRRRR